MTPLSEIEAEAVVMTTQAGRALRARVAAVAEPGPSDVARWRGEGFAPEVVAAACRLERCRRRAAGKLARPDAWWLDPVGLEQATAGPVAAHKASRFVGRGGTSPLVVDLCCGLGVDAAALGRAGARVLAVDRDAARCRRAAWNLAAEGLVGRTLVVRATAERFPIPPAALVHVDPDRRAAGARRARDVEDYAPGLPFLLDLLRTAAGGAIKLGPASDFDAHFGPGADLAGTPVEIELTSLGGECREATAWFGALAGDGVSRRATSLPSGATWTDRDGPPGTMPAPSGPVEGWIHEADPALGRAGLLDGFAAAHGLRRIAAGIDWLTGLHVEPSPWLARFAVRGVLPLDLKRLRRLVADERLGPLEVKTRGLDRPAEAIRAALRPSATDRPATLLLWSPRRGPSGAAWGERERVSPSLTGDG